MAAKHSSRYESFQDDMDEESNAQVPLPSYSTGNHQEGMSAMSDNVELFGNGVGGQGGRKRIRLRAVETEREYFLKLMNVDLFRKLVLIQAIASMIIVLSQVVLYAIVTRQTYKVIDYVGVGIWGPLIFFSTACWLTWTTTRSPSGCSVGTAMGFQITSIIVGLLLIIFATIALIQHGQYTYWRHDGDEYDPEITGRIFCSLMILSAVCITVTAVFVSIQFCRVTCCAKANAHETVIFDVEKA